MIISEEQFKKLPEHLKQQFMRKEDGVVAGGDHPT